MNNKEYGMDAANGCNQIFEMHTRFPFENARHPDIHTRAGKGRIIWKRVPAKEIPD